MILRTTASSATAATLWWLVVSPTTTVHAFSVHAPQPLLVSRHYDTTTEPLLRIERLPPLRQKQRLDQQRPLSSALSVSMAPTEQALSTNEAASSSSSSNNSEQGSGSATLALPPRDADTGVWNLSTPDDHEALMAASKEKLVILKVFAPWCRACKGLEPKFVQLSREFTTALDTVTPLPIEWASLTIQHNKAFVQRLGVLALPTIQFYVGGQLVDTFPCGPSKVPMLKRKLTALLADHVTYEGVLKPIEAGREAAEEAAAQAKEMAAAAAAAASPTATVTNVLDPERRVESSTTSSAATDKLSLAQTMTAQDRAMVRNIPYLSSMSLADLDSVLDQAVEVTFAPGSVLVREGKPGRTFYIIKSGEVEICQQTWAQFSDPMVQQSQPLSSSSSGVYLGSVVNRLGPGDYFGERALITGEPRAASLRAAEDEPVTLWVMDQDSFPHSSILSGKSKNTQQSTFLLDQVNDKYGVDTLDVYRDQVLDKLVQESATANQVRGSIHAPSNVELEETEQRAAELEDYVDPEFISKTDEDDAGDSVAPVVGNIVVVPNDDAIFSLLTRFQMIRHVSTCFRYIEKTRAVWGDPGSRKRRNMLVSRLSSTRRTEFSEIFTLMDVNQDGCLELNELKRLLESIGDITSEQLKSVFTINEREDCTDSKGNPVAVTDVEHCIGPGVMTFEDYMGIMAEAEFYYLFRDIFASLDEKGSGYVKASDLDRVLCGVRDLISDDRKSVIDVDDKDMLIDYEQFSRMLLGTTLI
jgi:calmodulin